MLGVFLFVIAVNIDTFALMASFGMQKYKISIFCSFVISIITSISLLISLFVSQTLSNVVNANMFNIIGCIILIIMGLYFILSDLIWFLLFRKHNVKIIKFCFGDFNGIFVLSCDKNIYKDTKFSFKNIIFLALFLSIDSITAGFAYGGEGISIWIIFLLDAFVCFFSVLVGVMLGRSIFKGKNLRVAWIRGLLLITLSILQLL